MPLIQYVHPADIAKHGEAPVEVSDLTAKVLVVERRRARAVLAPVAEPVDCGDCLDGCTVTCALAEDIE